MHKLDAFEEKILEAYERGELKSANLSQSELDELKAAARATVAEFVGWGEARTPT